ncbi:acyl-CoA dehydrogenase family protein [Arthrobacter castelli]|uniref:acyl-CoA dehydrogenase family protein n=1 Tax=Arthrobacter castelli TaxID=271431 RepID=UPI0003FE5C62|nr:acyl-CoA dehydrogenase family protein [Arthrobacter castelli]
MTTTASIEAETAPPTDAELAAKYRPVFERIAAGAVERERHRILPSEQIRWLGDAGFGAIRIPRELGGDGATLPQFFTLLIELAAADSNLPQALRSHFAFVEDRLYSGGSTHSTHGTPSTDWLRRIGKGQLVGNAWSETGPAKVGEVGTRIEPDEEGWRITGTKYYTTGSLFADWILTGARDSEGVDVNALVDTSAPGVDIRDDWDGFGQRLTASGTTIYDNVPVPAENVLFSEDRAPYLTGIFQLIHNATLAGICKAIVTETAAHVRDRTRVYSHGNGERSSADVQIQQVVGELSANAFATSAATLEVARLAQTAFDQRHTATPESQQAAITAVELGSSQTQVVAGELTQRSGSRLFDALGASATKAPAQLDRFWRNARTLSSHNPAIYKARILGDWEVNGNLPEFVWRAGEAKGI